MKRDNASRAKRIKVRMKDLPFASRPREKLATLGRENLTNEELIAILLGTGSVKQNALKLSKTLLSQLPLANLAQASLSELIRLPGIGKSKASRISAAIELGNRLFAPASFTQTIIQSTQDVLLHLKDIVEKKQEYLLVFYLNARFELLQREIVGQGSLNSMMITPKEIFSHALSTPCVTLIVAHNHPSGDPTPSDDDIAFTTRIHEAGEIMSITLLDHIIVGKNGYFSFRENKTVMKKNQLTE